MVQQLPERCELQHRVFTTLGGVRFHRSGPDGCAVMALTLGDREASIPLKSLRREFGLGTGTHDGMMLDLVGRSLDFVASLQPGDRFPPELLTGDASWQPSRDHLRLAATRLALDLACWLRPSSRWAQARRDIRTLMRLADSGALQAELETLAQQCAEQLGFAGGGQVLQALDDMSSELSFIEALRDRLLLRVESLTSRLGTIRLTRRLTGLQAETLASVGRLGVLAERQIRTRFDEVDAQTGQVAALLTNRESQRAFIRSNRDWLHRSERAWQPLLDRWDGLAEGAPELPALLTHTYQFLAPRFMPTVDWSEPRRRRSKAPEPAEVTW